MPFQIILYQMNLPQVNFTRSVVKFTSDINAPELNFYLINIYTVGTESIQTPLNFSLIVILQPFAKII